MYWDWYIWFAARGDRPDLTQWAVACYWRVFYVFYVQAAESGTLAQPGVKEGFAYHKKHLDTWLGPLQPARTSRTLKSCGRGFSASARWAATAWPGPGALAGQN